eukprot:325175_1
MVMKYKEVSKETAGLVVGSLITTVLCYSLALLLILHGKRLNVASTIPWTLCYICCGAQACLVLWDNMVPIPESHLTENRYLTGLNAFFGVMSSNFLLSAVLIDTSVIPINEWPWKTVHILVYVLVLFPFYMVICLESAADSFVYEIYPWFNMSILALSTALIVLYLRKLNIVKTCA